MLARARGHIDVIAAGELEKMQVDVAGVALVARRLLEVDAVDTDLLVGLFDERRGAGCAPSLGIAEFRERDAGIEESERFAGEMRVGREVLARGTSRHAWRARELTRARGPACRP